MTLTSSIHTLMIPALALILIGVLYLLRNTGLLPDPAWQVVWPLILIVIGGAVFFRGGRERGYCWPGCACMCESGGGNGRKRS